MKNFTFLFFLFPLLFSCNDKCEDIACTSPPPSIVVNFVDETSGENVFEAGLYDVNDLSAIETTDIGSEIWVNNNLLVLGMYSGTHHFEFEINLNDEYEFTIETENEEHEGECCNATYVEQIDVDGINATLNPENGVLYVMIP